MAPVRLYAVVEFNNNSIAVVPCCWVREIEPDKNVCLWPTGNVTAKIVNMVKNSQPPDEIWDQFPCSIKSIKGSFRLNMLCAL